MSEEHGLSLSCQRCEAGFSLLEMLVTLALLGLLLGLTSVQLGRTLEAAEFDTTVRRGLATLAEARVEALSTGSGLWIRTSETDTVPASNETNSKTHPTTRGWNLPPDFRTEGDDVWIDAAGRCSGGRVTFISPDGRQRRVDLSVPNCVVAPE